MEEQSSIVLELQRDAASSSTPLPEVLRRARAVAVKLKLAQVDAWIEHELNGYPEGAEVPDYRVLRCEVWAMNPYTGRPLPMQFDRADVQSSLTRVQLAQSIGSLHELLLDELDFLQVPFPAEALRILRKAIMGWSGHGPPTAVPEATPFRQISSAQVAALFDAVRNRIHDWALQLEAEGIMGYGLTFSPEERQRAANTPPSFNIGSVQTLQANIVGSAINSPVNQQQTVVVKRNDLVGLKKHLRANGLSPEDLKELVAAIKADPEPKKPGEYGPQVGAWIGKMVGKAAKGVWQIGVGAAGALLAQAIGAYYGWPR